MAPHGRVLGNSNSRLMDHFAKRESGNVATHVHIAVKVSLKVGRHEIFSPHRSWPRKWLARNVSLPHDSGEHRGLGASKDSIDRRKGRNGLTRSFLTCRALLKPCWNAKATRSRREVLFHGGEGNGM